MIFKYLEKEEKAVTENGGLGYKSTSDYLVDINYKIPSFRNHIDFTEFDLAVEENPNHALRWLLYLRDVRQGVGERSSFRKFLAHLCDKYTDLALLFIDKVDISEYGRWDDLIDLYFNVNVDLIKFTIIKKIYNQLMLDIKNSTDGKSVSLLAKWLPSECASSKVTKQRSAEIRKQLGLTPKNYRKLVSKLRKYIDVVECRMSKNDWSNIDYSKVPSKANLSYCAAFLRHDRERRIDYLCELSAEKTKINANSMFLYDIIHKYCASYEEDSTLEALWKAQKRVEGFTNTLVVRDGSASMYFNISSKSGAYAIDVADSLSIYCAENSNGEYRNKFITFSANPKVVEFPQNSSLFDKLTLLRERYRDCSTTNIYKVFKLILDTAVKNKLSQSQLPNNVLIISDMEFDCVNSDDTVFDTIKNEFLSEGYKLPKLVFWNVNSRTNVIPLTENENGVVLVSGFSKNILDMVMSSELDPKKALLKGLMVPRYDVVDSVIARDAQPYKK